jgi:hypothetical protein
MASEIVNEYADEVAERWPDKYAESNRNLASMTDSEKRDLFALGQQVTTEIAALFTSKVAADSTETQAQIARHYGWLSTFWKPNREAYAAMGQMYVADPRFTAYYDKFAPGLAPYMCAAILVYAEANLE